MLRPVGAGPGQISYIGAAAGIITEFIGATFMFIFRSTIAQANSFMSTLERINSVGMGVQILETIPDEDRELKSATKAELVKLLLQSSYKSNAANSAVTSPTTKKADDRAPRQQTEPIP